MVVDSLLLRLGVPASRDRTPEPFDSAVLEKLLFGLGSSLERTGQRNVDAAMQYFEQRLDRQGIDDAGRGVRFTLDQSDSLRGNARFLDGELRVGLGATDAPSQRSMAVAPDVMVHEVSHGVVADETGIDGGRDDEASAVAEAFADLFAAHATRDWRIGESLYPTGGTVTALRDLANPHDHTNSHDLWTSVSEARREAARLGRFDAHQASGVLTTPMVEIQRQLGWTATETLTYSTVTDGALGPDARLSDAASALRRSARDLWGEHSHEARVVSHELTNAGL